jgi:hypothetical protein
MWQAITKNHMVEKIIHNYTSFQSNTIFIWTTIPLIEMFVFTFNTFDMNENKQWFFKNLNITFILFINFKI